MQNVSHARDIGLDGDCVGRLARDIGPEADCVGHFVLEVGRKTQETTRAGKSRERQKKTSEPGKAGKGKKKKPLPVGRYVCVYVCMCVCVYVCMYLIKDLSGQWDEKISPRII